VSLHRTLIKYDRLFDEAESIRIDRDKLRDENAELKMAISPDELLPLKLINARLIEENSELRKLVEEAWTEALNSDRRGALNFEQWSEQHPILRYTEDLKDEQRSARHDAEEQP
jgi:hypothetical protein